ncbi:hypothetical protein T484DRAFT_1945300, partial [Baffinella frigidus]
MSTCEESVNPREAELGFLFWRQVRTWAALVSTQSAAAIAVRPSTVVRSLPPGGAVHATAAMRLMNPGRRSKAAASSRRYRKRSQVRRWRAGEGAPSAASVFPSLWWRTRSEKYGAETCAGGARWRSKLTSFLKRRSAPSTSATTARNQSALFAVHSICVTAWNSSTTGTPEDVMMSKSVAGRGGEELSPGALAPPPLSSERRV